MRSTTLPKSPMQSVKSPVLRAQLVYAKLLRPLANLSLPYPKLALWPNAIDVRIRMTSPLMMALNEV